MSHHSLEADPAWQAVAELLASESKRATPIPAFHSLIIALEAARKADPKRYKKLWLPALAHEDLPTAVSGSRLRRSER